MTCVDNDSDDSSDNCSHNSSSCQPSQSSDDQECWDDKEEDHNNGGRNFYKKDVSIVLLACISVLAVSSSFACGYYNPNSIRILHNSLTTLLFLPPRRGIRLCEDQETPKLDFFKDLNWDFGNDPSVVMKTDGEDSKLLPQRNTSLFHSDGNESVDDDEEEEEDRLDGTKDAEDDVFALAGHVLIDLNRIDCGSIDTEDKVFGLMMATIQEARYRLESYVCRKHQPPSNASENVNASAIQCLGMLADGGGHISLYAWPIDKEEGGRVFIDLFVTNIVSDAAVTHGVDDDGKGYDIPERLVWSTKHMLPELISLSSKIEDVFENVRVPPTSKDNIHEFVVKHIQSPLPHWTRPALRLRGKLQKEKPSDIAYESQDILVYQNVVRMGRVVPSHILRVFLN